MIKKIIAILLTSMLIFTSCSSNNDTRNISIVEEKTTETSSVEEISQEEELGDDFEDNYEANFTDLNDKELLSYIEDNVYNHLVSELDSDKYYVENVSVKYVSKEYLEELSYNSKSNIFFGYSLEDIAELYGDSKYIFTLGEDGQTAVQKFEGYDDTYEKIIKNVVIGTAVILVCVTVSVATGGAATPAISMIFATSAKTGALMAVSSATIGGVASSVVTAQETDDKSAILKKGMLGASEGFKLGAITGVIQSGSAVLKNAKYNKILKKLKGVKLHISQKDAAHIQMESKYPIDVIQQFHSVEEYNVFKKLKLKCKMVNGENALIKTNLDLKRKDLYGRTNLERMKLGLAPNDVNGNPYQLHHIGQEDNATLAMLTREEHNNSILHGFKDISEIDRNKFSVKRKHFWESIANLYIGK